MVREPVDDRIKGSAMVPAPTGSPESKGRKYQIFPINVVADSGYFCLSKSPRVSPYVLAWGGAMLGPARVEVVSVKQQAARSSRLLEAFVSFVCMVFFICLFMDRVCGT